MRCKGCGIQIEQDTDGSWTDDGTAFTGARLVYCHDQDETHDGIRHAPNETKITRLTPDQIKALDEFCVDLMVDSGTTVATFWGTPEEAESAVEIRRKELWKTHGGRGYPVQPLAMVRNKLRKQIAAS